MGYIVGPGGQLIPDGSTSGAQNLPVTNQKTYTPHTGGIGQYEPGVDNYPQGKYVGTYEEWVARAARALAEQYARKGEPLNAQGVPAFLDAFSGATGNIGQPVLSDVGSGLVSEATYDFFARYVNAYSQSDPYLASQFGPPPSAHATFGPDPNSPAAQTAANNAADLEKAKLTAASNEKIALLGEEGANTRNAATIASNEKIALINDATNRYIAEGNWGVQKYVAELQETGEMERLKLELGMRDRELAQRVLEEKNRHHEQMVNLALEVAKYDAELGSEPRNWLAYASWLANRDMVINGLNLAMAADMVPEEVAAQEAAQTAGVSGQIAAQMTLNQQSAQTQGGVQPGLADGSSGGAVNPAGLGGMTPEQLSQLGAAGQFVVAGLDLNNTNYADLARGLLGMQPGQATRVPTTAELQAAYDTTDTSTAPQGFGAWGGTDTTRQGVKVNPSGHLENYTNFSNLLPTQQEMRLGGVQEIRGKYGVNDFLGEMEKARPKGSAQAAAGYG